MGLGMPILLWRDDNMMEYIYCGISKGGKRQGRAMISWF
jgi:hypothetical protein